MALRPFVIAALKRRFVYPRIGYVELAQGDFKKGGRWLLGFGPILICGAVVFPLFLLRNPVQSTEAADGR